MDTKEADSIQIRRMVLEDVPTILETWSKDIPKEQKLLIDPQVRSRFDLSFVAEMNSQLIGFILARLSYVGMPITGVAVIHIIAVTPEYQDKGIGKLLIGHLNDFCIAEGINTMRALVPRNNVKLINYVHFLGFTPSPIINYDRPCKK